MISAGARKEALTWLRRSIAVGLVLFVAAGCASVNRLREAQDAFNQGAAAENQQRLAPGTATDTLTSLSSARTSYASALQSLDKMSDDDKKSLQNSGLWGTALTLKALCQWRLGEYSKALASVAEAQKAPEQIYPRDHALQLALPGLIKTDQAYDKILHPSPNYDAIKDLLVGDKGAVTDIARARAAVDPDHPVQVYLIQAQLAAFRNLTLARQQANPKPPFPDAAGRAAQTQLDELNAQLKKSAPDAQRETLVGYWAFLCGLAPPS